MKKGSTIFLQVIIILIALCSLAFLLWEPTVEGRNANATLFEIYFTDPFLAYAYASSILFFMALYKAFTIMRYVRENKTFSQDTLKALRTIKYNASVLIALIAAPVAYLFVVRPGDDIAGGVAMGLFMIIGFTAVAIVSSMFEKNLQRTVSNT